MKRSQESIDKKCLLLQELGFTIEHNDSCVSLLGVEFDFSTTGCDAASIMYTALVQMHDLGFKEGMNFIRQEFKTLMSLEGVK